MKVLQMAYTSAGGAGIAAQRAHKGLLASGVDSAFLHHAGNTPSVPHSFRYPNRRYSFLERLLIRVYPYRVAQKNARRMPSVTSGYDSFIFATSDDAVHLNEHVQSCDLVHLHGVAGWIDFPSFFENVRKPIVWTLHDRYPFTGGFSYAEDEERNREQLGALDEEIRRTKIAAYQGSTITGVLSPSRWLADEAAASEALGDFEHHHVPNAIDTETMRPRDRDRARSLLGLPRDKVILLFVSFDLGMYRKGFDLLLGALGRLPDNDRVQWAAIGRPPADPDPRVHYLGEVNDEETLSQAYSAADAFVLPSREDNLPNVMLESLCCGTPCIATPVGGIPDAVLDGRTGILAKAVDVEALEEAVLRFLAGEVTMTRQEIRDFAVERYALAVQAAAHRDIYERALEVE